MFAFLYKIYNQARAYSRFTGWPQSFSEGISPAHAQLGSKSESVLCAQGVLGELYCCVLCIWWQQK